MSLTHLLRRSGEVTILEMWVGNVQDSETIAHRLSRENSLAFRSTTEVKLESETNTAMRKPKDTLRTIQCLRPPARHTNTNSGNAPQVYSVGKSNFVTVNLLLIESKGLVNINLLYF